MDVRFGHIVLFCRDCERSRVWYETLGLKYSHGYAGMHWFELPPGRLMLHPIEEVKHSNGSPSLHLNVVDVQRCFGKVRSRGLVPTHHQASHLLDAPLMMDWGDLEFELVDPDGFVVVITQPGST
jgi:catechol 2,3-dioxygenase-like lactoylglutathione lyase family enzyme